MKQTAKEKAVEYIGNEILKSVLDKPYPSSWIKPIIEKGIDIAIKETQSSCEEKILEEHKKQGQIIIDVQSFIEQNKKLQKENTELKKENLDIRIEYEDNMKLLKSCYKLIKELKEKLKTCESNLKLRRTYDKIRDKSEV